MLPDFTPLWLSLRVAVVAMLLLFPLGILAAWWLAYGKPFPGKRLLETVLSLPMVLPPTVVGTYLLWFLGRGTRWGEWLNESAKVQLLFTWQGAVIASGVMAFPLFVTTVSAAFSSIERDLLEVGRTFGAGERVLLLQVIIPLSYRGILAGLALAFARALGEFGATLMVAGSIPGSTQTLPLALYSAVQEGQDREALWYTVGLTALAFCVLSGVGAYQRQVSRLRGEK
jgi:molybdate transport system permease protein